MVITDTTIHRFDSDTGLLKTLETVNNYNILIKDFPINGLLSATDIESIRVAIIDIFGHLKKIRNTNYPVARAQALVQAISRDLNEQLLKVLTSQQLMHVRYRSRPSRSEPDLSMILQH